ncbi:MAG: hypothetical protein A2286_09880 [Gammaproteobacteria bacterium RIFOXYA12_FULL_61_12]|nr:MAG: hypothetical protein A2286_09880 [Gammaproteobacteria bacterium RIFOXYA12_FULL_61_12]OGT88310.1 MAG: hypothetical protein A2514_01345 [Gammaproteobacteria bacterium RIFOXYD12_FULL_61_37]
MKRIGSLWPQVTDFENLLTAYRKARRGKGDRPEVARFAFHLERELLSLQEELRAGCYQPGDYRLFTLYERKPRLIAAAPFRDRVVHHAVMNVIEPPIDRRFIFDSWACRRDKGVHGAVRRYQAWARRYPYVLKMDIRAYFPSIDHALLKARLRRYLKDQAVLGLLDRIIDRGPEVAGPAFFYPGDDLLTPLERRRGIPIGNLTSQFFANLYLDGFDHWMQGQAPVYLRYVDDTVALSDDKQALAELRERVRKRLQGLRLRLHPRKAEISRTRDGLDLLGYRVFPDFIRLRDDNGHRMARKMRRMAEAYGQGRMAWPAIHASIQSWIGHVGHADSWGLRGRILCPVAFVRGGG